MIGFWTDDRIERLQLLWAEGLSAVKIGTKLGCSRNAAIGKLHRLKAPTPAVKEPIIRNRIVSRQAPEITKASAAIRQARHRNKYKREVRAQFRASGASLYSAAYRKHLPHVPEMTKGELRQMLATAVRNTAAL